jgi:hypothetical protein
VAYFIVGLLSQHLPTSTDQHQEERQYRQRVSASKREPGTAPIRDKNTTRSTQKKAFRIVRNFILSESNKEPFVDFEYIYNTNQMDEIM